MFDPREMFRIMGLSVLVAAAAALLLMSTAPRAAAAEPTNDQVAGAYILTYGLVAYELGLPRLTEIPAPTVTLVTQQEICGMYYEIGPERLNCSIYGMHFEGKVYLRKDLNWEDPAIAAIMVHEFVHFFQDVARGQSQTWCENFKREVHAYSIHLEVLLKLERPTPALRSQIQRIPSAIRAYEAKVREECSR